MKIRDDFVTNSSSSSFILTNKSDRTMTSEDFVKSLFEKILENSKDRFTLEPGESISYECGDNTSDGEFECFIHAAFGSWGIDYAFNTEEVSAQFEESHH